MSKEIENVISTREIMHVFFLFCFLKSGSFLSCMQIIQIFVQEKKLYKKKKKKKHKIPQKHYPTWKWFHNTFIVLLNFCHAIDVHTLTRKQLFTAMYGFGFNCQHLSSASSVLVMMLLGSVWEVLVVDCISENTQLSAHWMNVCVCWVYVWAVCQQEE